MKGEILSKIEKQTREFAQSSNLPFIDLVRFMQGKRLHGTPDRHPNTSGHRVIGEFLFQELVDKGVIEVPSVD